MIHFHLLSFTVGSWLPSRSSYPLSDSLSSHILLPSIHPPYATQDHSNSCGCCECPRRMSATLLTMSNSSRFFDSDNDISPSVWVWWTTLPFCHWEWESVHSLRFLMLTWSLLFLLQKISSEDNDYPWSGDVLNIFDYDYYS